MTDLRAPAKDRARTPEIAAVLSTLPNGLRVLVHADPQASEVIVAMQYRAGSKDDPPGRTGLAHLYEHLMFTGTPEMPGDYAEALKAAGARNVNASTNFDVTEYIQHGSPGMLEFLLFAEADRMRALPSGLEAEAIAQQRSVVLQEKRQRDARGTDSVFAAVSAGSHGPVHPYMSLPIGREVDILAITREDLTAWGSAHYGPSNATLLVAGPVEVEAVQALALAYFGGIPPGLRSARCERWMPGPQPTRRDSLAAVGVRHGVLLMTWTLPEDTHPDADLFSLIAGMISDADGPLREALCSPDGPASAVKFSVELRQLCGVATIEAALRSNDALAAAPAELAIRKVLRDVWDDPNLARRLDDLRAGALTRTLGALQQPRTRIAMLLAGEARLRNPDEFKRAFQRTTEASLTEICDLGREWLSPEPRYVLRLTPDPLWSITPGERRARPQIALSAAAAQGRPRWIERRLSCGVTVRLIERSHDGVAHLRWLSRRGVLTEPGAAQDASIWLSRWDRFEAGAPGSGPLAHRLRAQGVMFSGSVGLAATSLSATFPPDALAEALGGFADAVLRPIFASETIAAITAEYLEALARAKGAGGGLGRRTALRLLLGEDHPLARDGSENAEALGAMTADWLRDIHRRLIDPTQSLLIVAGPFAIDSLIAAIEVALKDWRGVAGAAAPAVSAPTQVRRWPVARVLPSPSASAILEGWRLTPSGDLEDELALDATAHALGERLNRLLRSEKGWSYGAGCRLQQADAPGAPRLLTIGSSVEPHQSGPALAAVKALLRELPSAPFPSAEEFDRFRLAETRKLEELWTTGANAVDLAAHLWLRDLAPAHFEDRLERLNRLSQDRLRGAQTLLSDPEAFVWLLEGPQDAIAKSLALTDQVFSIERGVDGGE